MSWNSTGSNNRPSLKRGFLNLGRHRPSATDADGDPIPDRNMEMPSMSGVSGNFTSPAELALAIAMNSQGPKLPDPPKPKPEAPMTKPMPPRRTDSEGSMQASTTSFTVGHNPTLNASMGLPATSSTVSPVNSKANVSAPRTQEFGTTSTSSSHLFGTTSTSSSHLHRGTSSQMLSGVNPAASPSPPPSMALPKQQQQPPMPQPQQMVFTTYISVPDNVRDIPGASPYITGSGYNPTTMRGVQDSPMLVTERGYNDAPAMYVTGHGDRVTQRSAAGNQLAPKIHILRTPAAEEMPSESCLNKAAVIPTGQDEYLGWTMSESQFNVAWIEVWDEIKALATHDPSTNILTIESFVFALAMISPFPETVHEYQITREEAATRLCLIFKAMFGNFIEKNQFLSVWKFAAPKEQISEKVLTLIGAPYFYNFATPADLERLMLKSDPGTHCSCFTVANTSDSYTVVVQKGNGVKSTYVLKSVFPASYHFELQGTEEKYESLHDFIQSRPDEFQKPLTGTMYDYPWFHGSATIEDAKRLLSNRPALTYLVRFSTQNDVYSISVVSSDRQIRHTRLAVSANFVTDPSSGKTWEDIPTFISKATLKLCAVSPVSFLRIESGAVYL